MIARRYFAGVFLSLLAVAIAKPISGQTYEGRELVKAQLIADTDAIAPGKAFTVGLLLRMAPHWQTIRSPNFSHCRRGTWSWGTHKRSVARPEK